MKTIIKKIASAGGRCMLIGGAVIDALLEKPIKDWDIEVYGLSYDKLLDILSEFGEPSLVGKSFGVIKLKYDGFDYDFSIPRAENRTGVGHKDFDITLNPDMSPEEAGLRRDLTINSMYINMHTDEIVDPFGGINDLKWGRIKHTNTLTFQEDPLRVLRIMQILPRKGRFVDPDTMTLCQSMVDTFNTIASERVFEEFNKLLLKTEKPSIGLNFLRESGWIKHFPELRDLIGCAQNPEWHPEGDVWTHTLMAVDNAAVILGMVPEEWKLAYMYGVLLHDVGKPLTTDPVELISHGHDKAGEGIARQFMSRITNEIDLIDKVISIVGNHMRPGQLQRDGAGISAWKRLHNDIRLDIIGHVSHADSCARPNVELHEYHAPSQSCFKYFEEFGAEKIPAVLTGKYLISKGHKHGVDIHFGNTLKRAYEYQIETGETDPEIIYKEII